MSQINDMRNDVIYVRCNSKHFPYMVSLCFPYMTQDLRVEVIEDDSIPRPQVKCTARGWERTKALKIISKISRKFRSLYPRDSGYGHDPNLYPYPSFKN